MVVMEGTDRDRGDRPREADMFGMPIWTEDQVRQMMPMPGSPGYLPPTTRTCGSSKGSGSNARPEPGWPRAGCESAGSARPANAGSHTAAVPTRTW